ncbi:MAG: PEP-CTERM sorting domain-containing protein [Verrucomicrobiota bacterium]
MSLFKMVQVRSGNLSRIAVAAVSVWFSSQSAQANFLLNGSFESPVIAPAAGVGIVSGATIGAGWVTDTGNSVLLGTQYGGGVPGGFWPGASDGNAYLFMGNSASAGAIHQDLALNANSYTLTFDLANFLGGFNGNGAKVSVNIINLGNSTSVLGAPQVFTRPVLGNYAAQSLSFSLPNAGNYRVSVTSASGFGSNVDKFDLSVVPEPSALTLLGSSLLLGFLFKPRRA